MAPSKLLLLPLVLLPLSAARAQTPQVAALAPAPAALAPSTSAALERALASIEADRVKADVFFLASDELGGRDTPSLGLRVAARYIRARLERLGFQPGAPEGFFYLWDLPMRQLDAKASKATLVSGAERQELLLGRDYFFSSRGMAPHELSGEVVYCGRGSAEELKGLALEGRWALVADAAPPPAGRGASPEDGERRRQAGQRIQALREAKALGMLFLTLSGPSASERLGADLERMRTPMISRGQRGGGDNPPAPFSEVHLEPRSGLLAQLAERVTRPDAPAAGTALGLTFSESRALVQDGPTKVENVCGFWPGSDPRLKDEVIIISAHYDHEGTRPDGTIYNGADDNASGTAGLLALAEALHHHGPLRRSVLIMWVSGEEKGLLGSAAWTRNPWLPGAARAVCNLNIDMIGRNAPDKLMITPTSARKEYNGIVRLAEKHGPSEGFPTLLSADDYWNRSDHASFSQNLKIPVAFLFSDVHEDYHRPTDDAEKIDCDKIRRVTRLVMKMIADLQGDELGV